MTGRLQRAAGLRADLRGVIAATRSATGWGVDHLSHLIDVVTLRDYRERMDAAMSSVVDVLEAHSERLASLEDAQSFDRSTSGAA